VRAAAPRRGPQASGAAPVSAGVRSAGESASTYRARRAQQIDVVPAGQQQVAGQVGRSVTGM
jgi:hypothetical protein